MRIIKSLFLFTLLFILFHFSPQLATAETLDNDQDKFENEEEDADYIDEAEASNESGDINSTQNDDGETEPKDGQGETESENTEEVNGRGQNSSESDSTELVGEDLEEQEADVDTRGNPKDTEIESDEAEEPEDSKARYQVSSNQELEIGARDPRVIDLKNDLGKLGFLSFPNPTDYFGEKTEQGVKNFQEHNGIPVSGVADKLTISKIEEVLSSPFQYGKNHPDIVGLKENLQKLGFVSFENAPNDYFGSQTEQGVKDFQEHHGLPDTGIADPVTKDKIEELANAPLSYGMNRTDAIVLKENLDKLGFASFNGPNDYFGTKTEQGVRDFQEQYGFEVTGIADADTVAKIEEIVSSPFQNGENHPDNVGLKENLQKLGFVSFENAPNDYFGSQTEQGVKAFQEQYGMPVTGIADADTVAKIEEIVSSPFQNGENHPDNVGLKENLQKLGFVSFENAPNDYFGSQTEQGVKDFQEHHGLPVTGIADPVTKDKIEELANAPLSYGMNRTDAIILKENLDKLGFASFNGPNDYFGTKTEQGVKDFQEQYGFEVTGIADADTVAKIEEIVSSPFQKGKNHPDTVELKENLQKLGFVSFENAPNDYFGSQTEQAIKKFQEYYGLAVSGIADPTTRELIQEHVNTPLSKGMNRYDAIALKEELDNLGFVSFVNPPNDYYGSQTEKAVKDFQEYHSLPVSGIADEQTQAKIEDVLSSPFQNGERHPDSVELKENLQKLGFVSFANAPNNYFGSQTEQAVKDFQVYHSLPVSGIADELTRAKIEDVLSSPFQNGERHPDSVELKENLQKLGFVSFANAPNNYFGSQTEQAVKDFQVYHSLPVSGIADEPTRRKIEEVLSSPFQYGERHPDSVELKENLQKLGFVSFANAPNNYFGSQTEQGIMDFQKENGLPISGIADEITLKELEKAINNNVIRIFLDPGHGGSDPGGQGHGLDEKEVVLDIALKAADLLASSYLGVEVNLSRTTDTFVELSDRVAMAENWNADYFVSIHNNAFNGAASGFESFIFNGNVSQETRDRQSDLHDYIVSRIDANDRGKKTANFHVLRETSMPAILLEYLFIDNAEENAKLKQKSYRETLGRITAEAIANSFGLNKK